MPEPTIPTTAAVTLATQAAAVPVLTVLGISLGLRPDILVAGFAGAVVAMALLNSVPSTGDTWQQLLRDSLRRMMVALASSATAGYLTPLTVLVANVPDSLLLGIAFVLGAGAQQMLLAWLKRLRTTVSGADPPGGPGGGGQGAGQGGATS